MVQQAAVFVRSRCCREAAGRSGRQASQPPRGRMCLCESARGARGGGNHTSGEELGRSLQLWPMHTPRTFGDLLGFRGRAGEAVCRDSGEGDLVSAARSGFCAKSKATVQLREWGPDGATILCTALGQGTLAGVAVHGWPRTPCQNPPVGPEVWWCMYTRQVN